MWLAIKTKEYWSARRWNYKSPVIFICLLMSHSLWLWHMVKIDKWRFQVTCGGLVHSWRAEGSKTMKDEGAAEEEGGGGVLSVAQRKDTCVSVSFSVPHLVLFFCYCIWNATYTGLYVYQCINTFSSMSFSVSVCVGGFMLGAAPDAAGSLSGCRCQLAPVQPGGWSVWGLGGHWCQSRTDIQTQLWRLLKTNSMHNVKLYSRSPD